MWLVDKVEKIRQFYATTWLIFAGPVTILECSSDLVHFSFGENMAGCCRDGHIDNNYYYNSYLYKSLMYTP